MKALGRDEEANAALAKALARKRRYDNDSRLYIVP